MSYHLPLEAKKVLFNARQNDKKLVLVTGVFDILHKEHINFLQKAKQAGDLLVAGVETDKRVRALKGPDRPINSEQRRVKNLDRLGIADGVFLLPANFDDPEEHRAFIRKIAPDVLAVSSHTPHLQQKREIMQGIGAELQVVHQYNPELSTSKIIENKDFGAENLKIQEGRYHG